MVFAMVYQYERDNAYLKIIVLLYIIYILLMLIYKNKRNVIFFICNLLVTLTLLFHILAYE